MRMRERDPAHCQFEIDYLTREEAPTRYVTRYADANSPGASAGFRGFEGVFAVDGSADLVVVGGGIAGSAVAKALLRRVCG
jgi:hypothetical protein